MAKASILTPVLAGVLGVSVIGSGVAYYNVYVKNADKDAKDGKKKDTAIALSVDEAAENIEAQIGKAQKIAKGEFDEGYKGTLTYTPPTGGELGQMGLKTVTIGAEAKQKDKMSGMDYTMAYDSTNLLTVNIVYDNGSETAYVKIPELSDAYLYGTTKEIESWANDNMGNPLNSLMTPKYGGGTDYSDFTIEDSAYTSAGTLSAIGTAASDSTPDLSALQDIDFAALFDDLATYVDTVKENAPAAEDADDYTVTSGSESVTLTTKRYTVTQSDAKKVVDAIAEKGKADATLTDLFTKMGMSSEDIDGFWGSLTDEVSGTSETDETVIIDVYYNGDEVQGFKAAPTENDENEQIYYVAASDKDKLIFECNIDADGEKIEGSGLVTMKDDALDGSLSMKSDEFDFTITFDKLTASEDTVKGKMSIDGGTDDQKVNINYDFDCEGNDSDITITGSVGGEDIGTVNITSTQTDASDISVPTGTGYNLANEQELQSFIESCDVEGWMNTVKGAVGDEIYNQIFGSMGSALGGGSSYSTDDYSTDDFDTDDYSIDDFDIDDYDTDDLIRQLEPEDTDRGA